MHYSSSFLLSFISLRPSHSLLRGSLWQSCFGAIAWNRTGIGALQRTGACRRIRTRTCRRNPTSLPSDCTPNIGFCLAILALGVLTLPIVWEMSWRCLNWLVREGKCLLDRWSRGRRSWTEGANYLFKLLYFSKIRCFCWSRPILILGCCIIVLPCSTWSTRS